MTTVRDVMSETVECVEATTTVGQAARKMRDLRAGALPVRGQDARLVGVVSDRDIVVGCVAAGEDPEATTVEAVATGEPETIGAEESLEVAVRTMAEAGVRRLPVLDGNELVGVLSLADLVRHLPEVEAGELIRALSSGLGSG